MPVNPNDVLMTRYNPRGKEWFGKTNDFACTLTHTPTGLTACSESESTLEDNRALALTKLNERYDAYIEREGKLEKAEKERDVNLTPRQILDEQFTPEQSKAILRALKKLNKDKK